MYALILVCAGVFNGTPVAAPESDTCAGIDNVMPAGGAVDTQLALYAHETDCLTDAAWIQKANVGGPLFAYCAPVGAEALSRRLRSGR
jgi:hypothetical protein